MLRKLKQNIFPHIRRQVHAVIHNRDTFLTLERQQAEEHVAWLLHEWETLSESLAAHE